MILAIAFSAFLALTLTPALCATMLKPVEKGHHLEKRGFFGWFNRMFDAGNKRYEGVVAKILRNSAASMVIWLAVGAGAVWMYARLPESFLPVEDSGNFMVSVQLPAGASKARTDKTIEAVEKVVMAKEEVESIITVSGFSFSGSGQNMAIGFVSLKDWDERPGLIHSASIVAQMLMGELMTSGAVKDGFALAVNPPAIRELGNGGIEFYLQDRNNSGHAELMAKSNELLAKMAQNPMFSGPRNNGLPDSPHQHDQRARYPCRSLGRQLRQRLPQQRPPAESDGSGRSLRPYAGRRRTPAYRAQRQRPGRSPVVLR